MEKPAVDCFFRLKIEAPIDAIRATVYKNKDHLMGGLYLKAIISLS